MPVHCTRSEGGGHTTTHMSPHNSRIAFPPSPYPPNSSNMYPDHLACSLLFPAFQFTFYFIMRYISTLVISSISIVHPIGGSAAPHDPLIHPRRSADDATGNVLRYTNIRERSWRGPFNPEHIAAVCRAQVDPHAHIAGIPDVDEIAAYILESGYLDDPKLLQADPNCEMLVGGLDSTQLLLFKAAMTQDDALYQAAFHRLESMESSFWADSVAERVYNLLIGTAVWHCVKMGPTRDPCNAVREIVGESTSVKMALFLKFGFNKLYTNVKLAWLFDMVTTGVESAHIVTMADLKQLHNRNLMTLHGFLVDQPRATASIWVGRGKRHLRVERMIEAIKYGW